MITYKQLCEKLFDGTFGRKNVQDETLEVLQHLGKMVDSRKVKENRITLRNGILLRFNDFHGQKKMKIFHCGSSQTS